MYRNEDNTYYGWVGDYGVKFPNTFLPSRINAIFIIISQGALWLNTKIENILKKNFLGRGGAETYFLIFN